MPNISSNDHFIPEMDWHQNTPAGKGIRKYGSFEGAIREVAGKALKLTTEKETVYLDKQETIEFLASITPGQSDLTVKKITEKVDDLADSPGSPISFLQRIGAEVRLADKINKGEISLKEVRDKHPEMLRRISPYLEKIDLSDPSFHSLSHDQVFKFLEECPNVTSLDVTGNKYLRTLPNLPKLTFLCCDGCESLEKIPRLPELSDLSCRGCTRLKTVFIPLGLLKFSHGCEHLGTLPFELVDEHGILSDAKNVHHILSGTGDWWLSHHRILDGTTRPKAAHQVYSVLEAMKRKGKEAGRLEEKVHDLLSLLNKPVDVELSTIVDGLKEMQSGDFLLSAMGFIKHQTLACWEKIGNIYYCSVYDTGDAELHRSEYSSSRRVVLPLRFKFENFEEASRAAKTLWDVKWKPKESYEVALKELKQNNSVEESEYNKGVEREREDLDSAYNKQTVGACGHESYMALILDRLGRDKFKEFKIEELGQASELLDRIARKIMLTQNQTTQTTSLFKHEVTILSSKKGLIHDIFERQRSILNCSKKEVEEGTCPSLGYRKEKSFECHSVYEIHSLPQIPFSQPSESSPISLSTEKKPLKGGLGLFQKYNTKKYIREQIETGTFPEESEGSAPISEEGEML